MSYVFPTRNGGRLLSTQPFKNGNMLGSTATCWYLTNYMDHGFYTGMQSLEWEPGLFSRSDERLELTSIDDYMCAACIPVFAKNILAYGRKNFWFMGARKWNRWFGRFPGLIAHAKVGAGEELGLWDRMVWSVCVLLCTFKPVTNQDSWMQTHLMVVAAERNKSVSGWAMRLVVARFKRVKPLPTHAIVAQYLQLRDHPLITAWRDYG